jgi:hypothetical protein
MRHIGKYGKILLVERARAFSRAYCNVASVIYKADSRIDLDLVFFLKLHYKRHRNFTTQI